MLSMLKKIKCQTVHREGISVVPIVKAFVLQDFDLGVLVIQINSINTRASILNRMIWNIKTIIHYPLLDTLFYSTHIPVKCLCITKVGIGKEY